VSFATFSPGGVAPVSGAFDKTIRLWRAPALAETDREPGR
jgi:WD40 repeat protein